MLDAVTRMLSVIVTVYGLVSGASSLLQARQLVRRGTSSGVSLAFLGLYVAGYGLWLRMASPSAACRSSSSTPSGSSAGPRRWRSLCDSRGPAPRTPDSALGLAA